MRSISNFPSGEYKKVLKVYSKFIKRTTASLLFPSLFHTRSHLLLKPFYSGLGSILMFHRVCPKSSKPRIRGNAGLEVTPEYLENMILFLRKNNYEIVPLGRVDKILNENLGRKKFAVFTFDDGYIDNYLHAYPILKKYEIEQKLPKLLERQKDRTKLAWALREKDVGNIGDRTMPYNLRHKIGENLGGGKRKSKKSRK